MGVKGASWKVRDKGRLLLALMESLEGNAHVSFEGDLRSLPLSSYPGVSCQPTDALKQNNCGRNKTTGTPEALSSVMGGDHGKSTPVE